MLRVAALAGTATAWYLPGMAPTDYSQGEEVPVLVNRLTSTGRASSGSLIGYDYYNPHFRFCAPQGGEKPKGGSLGAILFGDRIYTSPIVLKMLEEESCHRVCTVEYRPADAEFVSRRIMLDYEQHWLVDGLPISGQLLGEKWVSNIGFPLGEPDLDEEEDKNRDIVQLHNHFDILIDYHFNQDTKKYRIVGATLRPSSRKTATDGGEHFSCEAEDNKPVLLKSDSKSTERVTFSYSVTWQQSQTPWATRWDKYLQGSDPLINWFALINTTVLVFCLGIFCALLLMRMVRKDIARYNDFDLGSDEIPEEMGWKMVRGDVFRSPSHAQAYAVALGSGAQILVTLLATLTLAVLGFLSPANRGSFTSALLLLNSVFGGIGGYVSAAVYKTWGGVYWKSNLLLTPLVMPAIVFFLFLCGNFMLVFNDASGAVPIGSIVVLVLIWFGISVPLSVLAGFFAFKRPVPFPPTMRVNQIPRQIPPQPWTRRTWAMMMLGGLIPFLAVSIQLRYIMSAIWFSRVYYMFGFLFASIWAMVLLSVSSSLIALYFLLLNEDYRWQWRTFCVAGSPSLYVLLYSFYYLGRGTMLATWTGGLLYVCYSALASSLLFLALGSVGSVSAYIMVTRIYESIKLD